jgi:hypothetical protein
VGSFQQASDGAAPKGHLQGAIEPSIGRLGGAQIAAYGHVHADIAGRCRGDSADQEANSVLPSLADIAVADEEEQNGHHHCHHGHRAVLPVKVRGGALLNIVGDILHPLVSLVLRQYPPHETSACHHAYQRADDGEPGPPVFHRPSASPSVGLQRPPKRSAQG